MDLVIISLGGGVVLRKTGEEFGGCRGNEKPVERDLRLLDVSGSMIVDSAAPIEVGGDGKLRWKVDGV